MARDGSVLFSPGRRAAVAWLLALALAGCAGGPAPQVTAPLAPPSAAAPAQVPPGGENLNSTLWVQTAAEYRAAALQAFAAAREALDEALADPTWTAAEEQSGDFAHLPPAVILDVDETVLDNSPYEARLLRRHWGFDREMWNQWCRESRAEPIAGALEFTRYAAARGVTVFYVTNRQAILQEATRENLRLEGFPLSDERETVYTRGLRPEWESGDKGPRRAAVAAEFRVLLLLGDNLGDFISDIDGSVAERAALVAEHGDAWGERWILLPNPMYGSWVQALYGFERGLSEEEILHRKYEALKE